MTHLIVSVVIVEISLNSYNRCMKKKFDGNVPSFIGAAKRLIFCMFKFFREETKRKAVEAEVARAAEAEAEKLAEQERLRDEEQRRRIQDALNRQTFTQVGGDWEILYCCAVEL